MNLSSAQPTDLFKSIFYLRNFIFCPLQVVNFLYGKVFNKSMRFWTELVKNENIDGTWRSLYFGKWKEKQPNYYGWHLRTARPVIYDTEILEQIYVRKKCSNICLPYRKHTLAYFCNKVIYIIIKRLSNLAQWYMYVKIYNFVKY